MNHKLIMFIILHITIRPGLKPLTTEKTEKIIIVEYYRNCWFQKLSTLAKWLLL